MQASKLLLDHYYLDELHFALKDRDGLPAVIDEDVPLKAEDVDTIVEVGQNPDDELEFFFRLTIGLADKGTKYPYEFLIKVSGFFTISPECEPPMRQSLATVNGPSLLYGAAREMLASVSSRSRCLPVFLPPIRFFPYERVLSQDRKQLREGTKPTKKRGKKAAAKKK